MLKCIIVDDERMILNELKTLIEQCSVEVSGVYQNPINALNEIESTEPDVAFLDIEMPEINGIELAKKFIQMDIQVVFITAYQQYAIKAFGISAVHYLLKPAQKQDIDEALSRVEKTRQMSKGLGNIQSVSLIKNKSGVTDRISVRDKEDIIVIKLSEILYLSAYNGVTTITTKTGSYKTRKGLHFWEEWLGDLDFIRCHKSYIVNADYISKMIHLLGEYKELTLSYCDVRIPISRRKIKDVKAWLGLN